MRTWVLIIASVATAAAAHAGPATEDWAAWKHRLPVVLSARDPATAGALPVDFTFAIFADDVSDPARELRLVQETPDGLREAPFQLSGVTLWTADTDGKRSKATVSGTATFFDQAGDGGEARYYLLYGNPAAETPSYASDLGVTGTVPALTIRNSRMSVVLHRSGQLGAVTPAGQETPMTSARGILHWEPGIFIPTRRWGHAWDWDPPEMYEVETGPVFVQVRRAGTLPDFPEMRLAITYRIFADRPYVECATRIEIKEDIGVVSLRNDQLVFDGDTFSHFAWAGPEGVATRRFADCAPVNQHGDILRIALDAPFVAFYHPEARRGAATVRAAALNMGPDAQAPVLFDHATYLTRARLQYWFRPLVYFHADWPRQNLIRIPRGSVYAERNFYIFFSPPADAPLAPVEDLARAVRRPPRLNIGPYRFPPAE